MVDAVAPRSASLRKPPWRALLALLALAVLAATYIAAYRVSLDAARQAAAAQAAFFRSTLDAALERSEALPFVLARDAAVIGALSGGDRDALNRRLATFAEAAQVEAIYLMDRTGLTIAASNWDAPVTFLGQNYGFRPYFTESIAGGRGSFFAIGATSGRPGYFVSEPVRGAAGGIIGVIAVKTGLDPLAAAWASSGERVMVVNPDGVVVLTSLPDTIYRTLAPLGEARRRALSASRQFGDEPLQPLDYARQGDGISMLDGLRYVEATLGVGRLGWEVHYLRPVRPAHERARAAVMVALILLMIGLATVLVLRTRRIRSALRIAQDDRRTLRRLNEELEREIEVRRAAEARLEAAQSELAATSRLAALGRLSASVTHELGQPLSALRNYIASLRMNGAGEDLGRFADRMEGVTARMEALTRQLRFFAQPGQGGFEVFDLRAIVPAARDLLSADLERLGIAFEIEEPGTPLPVRGNRLRLEQVLVNLLQNARDALDGTAAPRIALRLGTDGTAATLAVADTGAGIDAQIAERLFEPFTSTKASGVGMGLGLAISRGIMEDHAGTLAAAPRPEGGAVFTMRLPLAGTGEAGRG